MITPPPQPENSYRVTLALTSKSRLDGVLLAALRNQTDVPTLKTLSRNGFKSLFREKRIRLKGQNALPSSLLAAGTTFVDILGIIKS